MYHHMHKKGSTEETSKKRSLKTVKHQRAIVGASWDQIKAKRNQLPEVRKAARDKLLKEAKAKKAEMQTKKKAEKAKVAATRAPQKSKATK